VSALDPLLTTGQVAELLGVHPETVLRWTDKKGLPGYRLPGGALRYQKDAVEEWLEDHAVHTP
jgi:excisionase family DNA binding protein